MTYRVETKDNAWSYVVGGLGDEPPKYDGPWRYRWEAQEYADEMNAKARCPDTIDMFKP